MELPTGWYLRSLGKGLLPVLTNTPPDHEYCGYCGQFVPARFYSKQGYICLECNMLRQRPDLSADQRISSWRKRAQAREAQP